MKKSLGDRLRDLRSGASQVEIANKIGVSGQSWGFYERDQKEPTLETIGSICRLFGVSSDWLLGLSDAAPGSVPAVPEPQADAYWRDLVASQQGTISSLTALLADARVSASSVKRLAPEGFHSAIADDAAREIGKRVEKLAETYTKGRSTPAEPARTGGRPVTKTA